MPKVPNLTEIKIDGKLMPHQTDNSILRDLMFKKDNNPTFKYTLPPKVGKALDYASLEDCCKSDAKFGTTYREKTKREQRSTHESVAQEAFNSCYILNTEVRKPELHFHWKKFSYINYPHIIMDHSTCLHTGGDFGPEIHIYFPEVATPYFYNSEEHDDCGWDEGNKRVTLARNNYKTQPYHFDEYLDYIYDEDIGAFSCWTDKPMIRAVVCHEYAHHVCRELHGPSVDGHGPHWQQIYRKYRKALVNKDVIPLTK